MATTSKILGKVLTETRSLRAALESIEPLREAGSTRFALAGYLVEFNGRTMRLVATNGRQLCAANVRLNVYGDSGDIPSSMIIAPDELAKLRRNLPEGKASNSVSIELIRQAVNGRRALQIAWDNGRAGKAKREYSAVCQEMDGRFPNWRDVVGDQEKERGALTFDLEDWHRRIELWRDSRAYLLSGNGQFLARQEFKPFPIAEHTGADLKDVWLDLDMLFAHVETLRGKQATLSFSRKGNPVVLRTNSTVYVQAQMAAPKG